MFRFLHLLTAGKSAATFRAVVTVGAIAGGAAWAVSLDEKKLVQAPVSSPASPTPEPPVAEMSAIVHRVVPPEVTLFIVSSEESAAALRSGFVDLAAFRWAEGLPPRHDEVLLVPNYSEAVRLAEALSQESRALAENGMNAFNAVVVNSAVVP